MTLDLKGKRVVVTGGKHPIERAIAEPIAQEGGDVVIWLRKWDDDGNEPKVLLISQLEIPSQRPNGASSHTSLWSQSMGRHAGYNRDSAASICRRAQARCNDYWQVERHPKIIAAPAFLKIEE